MASVVRSRGRSLRFECHENRRMLAAMADVVFLVDESGTEQDTASQDWLASVVDDLDDELQAVAIDARYGVVGFGSAVNHQYAHSHLLGPSGSEALFTSDVSYVASVLNGQMEEEGGGVSR